MSDAKHQHWLSQFYLRQFAVPGYRNRKRAKIWLWTKDASVPIKRKINEICAEEFLYSHLRPDGRRCFHAERKLASLEATISRFYSRLSEGFPDLEQAGGMKKLFSLFLATLLLRHPSEREGTRDTHRAMVAWCETLPRDSNGRPIIPDLEHNGRRHSFDNSRWEEYRNEDENGITRMFAEGIEANARSLANELLKKRWAFLCLKEPLLFTSDFPLAVKHVERPTSGLSTPGVHVFFPLTPKRMLHMTDRQNNPDGFYPFPRTKACQLNFFTMGNSKQVILSHEQPASMLQSLDTYMNEMIAGAYRQHSVGILSPA